MCGTSATVQRALVIRALCRDEVTCWYQYFYILILVSFRGEWKMPLGLLVDPVSFFLK